MGVEFVGPKIDFCRFCITQKAGQMPREDFNIAKSFDGEKLYEAHFNQISMQCNATFLLIFFSQLLK